MGFHLRHEGQWGVYVQDLRLASAETLSSRLGAKGAWGRDC